MQEFIEKLIGRLEERKQLHNRMIAYEQKSGTVTEEFQQRKAVEVLDNAIEIVNQLAEEYQEINIITDFLQYVRDNANNYDADNGWDLSDLIDLSIKFCDAEEYNNDFCEWGYDEFEEEWQTGCGVLFELHDSNREIMHYCPYCGKKIKVVEPKGE